MLFANAGLYALDMLIFWCMFAVNAAKHRVLLLMEYYYLYQCENCYTTLYADDLPDGEDYTSACEGLCSSCYEAAESSYRNNQDD